MRRTNPSYPDAPAAETNSGMRCPGLAARRGAEGAGATGRFTSRGTACGGGAGSGVEAYIVSGICAWAIERSTPRRSRARRRCTASKRRSNSSASTPIAPCASETPGGAPSAASASTALATARQ